MAERKPAKKGTKKTAKGTTAPRNSSTRFTAEERAAMKERARELKAASNEAEAEQDVLAAIAKMPGSDRAMAKRLHTIIKDSAPGLSPKTWYGMPAYARTVRSSASSAAPTSSKRGTRCSASMIRRISTKALCGRSLSR